MGNASSNSKSPKGTSLHHNLVPDNQNKLEDTYNIVEQALASGTSTQIKQATMKKFTKTERTSGVAIKLYDGKAQIQPDLKLEAEILGQCDHPNIIRLYEVAKVGKSLSLVMELCTGGRLLERMPFTEPQASHIMRQLMSAIAYLHKKNIVHRDIECSNILYRNPDKDSYIKLVDFGSATTLEMVPKHPGAFKFLSEKTGSLHVMAPEVITQRYGPKADVWSLGIVAYMILNNGQHPFTGSSV
jgi:serine/threonine protein kinase